MLDVCALCMHCMYIPWIPFRHGCQTSLDQRVFSKVRDWRSRLSALHCMWSWKNQEREKIAQGWKNHHNDSFNDFVSFSLFQLYQIYQIFIQLIIFFRPIELSEVDRLPKEVKRLFLAYQEGSMLDETCSSLYGAICPLITKSW